MRSGRDVPFGARLRRLREGAGLTQEELAARSGLTAKGISALERGERRRPYPHTVRSLADALGLAEGERAAFVGLASGRGAPDPPPDAGLAASAVPPAPPTRLIGRERELDEVGGMLRRGETRLLTLTGAGGIGKTRLALELARAAEDFPDGVIFVPLASLRDADLVGTAVSQALGLRETGERTPFDAVRAHLREKKALLVLDNFEHVAEAAPEVPALIEACKDATVLVTSRAPLRVRGEQEYPVPPLRLPVSGEVLGSPSGRLFVERARAASPAFGLSAENAWAVAEICHRLDGLPLALELAAARTRFLDPASLLKRLDRALSASGGAARDLPERQRTMRAALDWSHDLLSDDEKTLFRRLSVFAGGWTLEAAEAVGAGEGVEAWDVLELLGRLVEQSLVLVEPGGELRYRMLEPVRQYALERLEDVEKAGEAPAVQGEEGRVRERHAGYYLALAEEAGPGLKGPDQGLWVRRLVAELNNIRSALGWAVENGGAGRVAQTAWASWTFWWTSGNINEGRRWMEEALAAEPDLPAPARAKLLFVAATLGQALGDFEATRPMIEESRILFERLGDKKGVGDALGTAGLIALGLERPDEGLALMGKSIDLDLEVGNEWGAAAMLGFSATVPFARGDLDHARHLAERGLALAREIGARDITYVTLYPLAAIALAEGDHERARALFEEGASLSLEVGEKVNVAFCLEGLAAVAASGDEPERAARLWGAAEAMLEEAEVIAYPYASDRSLHRHQVSEARARLEDAAWTRAWAEGRAMTAEEAVAYAIEGDETNLPA